MNIQQQFEKELIRGVLPIFEIPVIDKRTGENDYLIFNISANENEFIATHVALNSNEEESNKIAFKSIEIDEDFSLQWHLEGLYDEIWHAINDSEFFKHRDEE